MRLHDLLNLVGTNLRRTRFRVALSASGVLIGAAAVVILVSLAAGLQAYATRDLSSIGSLNEINVLSIRPPPAADGGGGGGGRVTFFVGLSREETEPLTPKVLADLVEQPEVAAATPREQLSAASTLKLGKFESGAAVFGVDAEAFQALNPALQSGSLDLGRWEAVVGAEVGESFTYPRRAQDRQVEALDLQGETLTLTLTRTNADGQTTARTVRLRVVGVLAPRGGEYEFGVYLRLPDFEELNTWATGERVNRDKEGYSQATVLASSPEDVAGIVEDLQEQGFLAFSVQQILTQINRLFTVLQAFVGGVGVLALIIAGTGIANTLITAIYERTREIGLMKAVGATGGQVMGVFLAEAAVIGGLGGAGGLALGLAISEALDLVAQQFVLPALSTEGGVAPPMGDLISTPLWVFALVPLFAAGVGVLAGLYPARRAAALDPVVALRSE